MRQAETYLRLSHFRSTRRELMPLHVYAGAPTLFVRREAFERARLTRNQLDERLNLTADEFRVERDVIAIGPIHAAGDLPTLLEELERLGLVYFDDFFELSGSWPEWLRLYASSDGGG
jgi:hypothetical protein